MNYKQFAFRNLRNFVLEFIKLKDLSYDEVLHHPALAEFRNKNTEIIKITTAKQLDEITAFALKKKGHSYQLATIQNNSAENKFKEKHAYSWDQCKVIANLYSKIVSDKVNAKLFEGLIEDFLRANDDDDCYDIQYETRRIIGKTIGSRDNPNSELIKKKGDLILKDIQKKIDQTIQNEKFVFLSGAAGSGKKIRADYAYNEWYENGNFDYKIRIDCEKEEISFPDFLKKIWSVFHEGREYSKSIKVSELMGKVQESLSDDVHIILFLNGFDCIKNPEDQKNIIFFLEKNVSVENIIILTSTAKKENFKYIDDLFTEIEVPKCPKEEWMKLASFYKSKHQIAREAEKSFRRVAEIAFNLGAGNPKKLIYYYKEICNLIRYEDITDSNPETNKILFKEIIKDLNDDCIYCLIVLSLFSSPISEVTLRKISGLKNEQLSESIGKLKSKLLIKVEEEKDGNLYSLPHKLEDAITEEKKSNSEKYAQIFERWIDYFTHLTSFSDSTFDNIEKQKELKELFINIGRVLEFLEEQERWKEYCCISQMMW